MRSSLRTFWTTGLVVSSACFLAAIGCADDDDDTRGGAGAGRGGTASAGAAGGGKGGTTAGSSGSGGYTAGSGNTGDGGAGADGNGGAGADGNGGAAGNGSAGAAGNGSAGAAGNGSGGAGGEGGDALTCQDYCDWVQTGCAAAADTQYPSENQCLQSCLAFPTGAGDNSLACRLEEAALIADDVSHCDAAGPAGVGVCGSPCESYCNLMVTYCAHEAEGESVEACLAECATVPGNDLTTFVYPAPGGDTLACRIGHATNAAADPDPDGDNRLLHCNHAAGDLAPCADATP